MMIYDLLLIANVVTALYIWFDTDAFIEWAELFHLKIFKYTEYRDNKKTPMGAMFGKVYTDFLLFKYKDSFFIKLITCPVCFSVWINIVAIAICYNKLPFIILGFNIIISWLAYHLLKWSLKKINA
jgi:hypothetical protein